MSDQISEFKLEDRPKLRLVAWLKWLSIVAFVVAVIMMVAGLFFGYLSAQSPFEDETTSNIFLESTASLLESFGYFLISFGFYGLMLWLASKAVDFLDQLVWLNATDEDRRKIISQRTK